MISNRNISVLLIIIAVSSITLIQKANATYNKINTYEWYRERVYKVNEEPGYDPTDREAAFRKALEWGDRIPIGILYRSEERPTYEEQVSVLKSGPLVLQPLNGRLPDYEALKEELV